MAALENGIDAVAASSGAAAVLMVVMALAKAGDNIVSSRNLYGGTYAQFDGLLPSFGVTTRFTDFAKGHCESLIDGRTKLIFCESIANPQFSVADYDSIVAIAREAGIPVVVGKLVLRLNANWYSDKAADRRHLHSGRLLWQADRLRCRRCCTLGYQMDQWPWNHPRRDHH